MKRITAILLCCIAFAVKIQAQENNYPSYDTNATELKDIQQVINNTLPDVEGMLKKSGHFKPFASVLLANDSVAEISVKDTSKAGYTEDDLKEELSIGALRGEYKAVVIFYLTKVNDPESGKETRALGVFAEHTEDDFAYLFYYPYKITARKEVIFGDSFGDFAPQVMFKAN